MRATRRRSPARSRPSAAGLRIREAFDLYQFGEDLMRAKLRRETERS